MLTRQQRDSHASTISQGETNVFRLQTLGTSDPIILKGTKFCHPKTAFWHTDFKSVMSSKKQKTQKEHLTTPPVPSNRFRPSGMGS